MEQNRVQKEMHTYMINKSMTKEVRICSGEKRASSINGVGETGQLHAKESIGYYAKLNKSGEEKDQYCMISLTCRI